MTELLWALAGVAAGTGVAVVSLLPGLHIYNIIATGLMVADFLGGMDGAPPEFFLPLITAMVVNWALLNSIPSILLNAPDESTVHAVLPGQKHLMDGRGFEGVMLTAAGGVAGLGFLLLAAPLAPFVLPPVQRVMQPHTHWILWVVILFMLQSEWPRGGYGGSAGGRKLAAAWRGLGAGLATFLLSGLLGFLLLYRSPLAVAVSFQNIMPAFVGLFAVPGCLVQALSRTVIPPQRTGPVPWIDGPCLLRGAGAGMLGGAFSAFMPIVTGGVGGMLAGHATALRDERSFLVSQGTSKLVYTVGGFLLFFVPGLGLRRGGAAWMLQGRYLPGTMSDYLLVLGAVALSGALALLWMPILVRATLRLLQQVSQRRIATVSLAVIVSLVAGVTGWAGLAVMAVAAGIGLLPLLYGSRRLNGLGVLLLPMACTLSGWDAAIAALLRLD